MKARIKQDQVLVLAEPNDGAPTVAVLREGDDIRIGTSEETRLPFIPVTLATGTSRRGARGSSRQRAAMAASRKC